MAQVVATVRQEDWEGRHANMPVAGAAAAIVHAAAGPESSAWLTWAVAAVAELLGRVPMEQRPKAGLILGTRLGCLEADLEFDRSRRADGGRYASPAAFARTLPSTAAGVLSVRLGLQGPVLVVQAAQECAGLAVDRARDWIDAGMMRWCIAGACEESTGMEAGTQLLLLAADGADAAV